jgi:diguanylate cyclase (GGDEF)-like protein/PAS domain S-box-containing protein
MISYSSFIHPKAEQSRLTRLLLPLTLSLFFLCGQAHSQNPVLLDTTSNAQIFLLPHALILTDDDHQLDIQQVMSAPYNAQFKPLSSRNERSDQILNSYWLKFSLSNKEMQDLKFWLEIDNVSLSNVELYKQSETNSSLSNYQLIQNAVINYTNPKNQNQKKLNHLPINLEAQETRTFYLKVNSSSVFDFSGRIYSEHKSFYPSVNLDIQRGIIYGILFALFIYMLNIYATLRDRTFLYFLIILAAAMIQVFSSQDTVKIIYFNSYQSINSLNVLSSVLGISASLFFIRRFLSLSEHNPRLDKLIKSAGLISLLVLPTYHLSPSTTDKAIFFANGLTILMTLFVCCTRFKKGYTPAIFPLVGSLFTLLPILIIAIIPEKIIPSIENSNLVSFCIALKMIAWASGLGSRIDNVNQQLNNEIRERKLRENQLMQAQHIAQYGDWSLNTDTSEFVFSASAKKILPKISSQNENNFDSLIGHALPSEREKLEHAFSSASTDQQGFRTEFSLQHDDGSIHHYLTQAEFQLDKNNNKTSLLIGTLHDITDKKLADLAYQENEQRWRDLADSTFEGILIFQDSVIIDANQNCKELLGLSPTNLIGNSGESFISKHDLPDLLKKISAAENNAFELNIHLKNLPEKTIEIRSKRGNFNQKEVHIVAIRDISERKEYDQKLQYLGYHDSLTGLANRTLFLQRLQRAIEKSYRTQEQHALLFIDLDQFKNINDSLGHDVGDKLLIEVAQRLKLRSRKVDTVARLGGDEFAILVEDISAPYSAAKMADELLKVMSEIIQVDGYQLLITPSMGIALYPADGDSSGELLRKADTAMYHAKNQGRNNYQFYTEQLNEKIVRRMDLESELRLAIERNELSLNFQPKINLTTGEIIGAEALLRWDSTKHGNISPNEFIPIAEETGLIWPIGELVLDKACQQAKQWIKNHPFFGSIAVNISGTQFNHKKLVATVAHALTTNELPAQHLELEITESAIIDNAEEAIKMMEQLKVLGVKLSLDDFGTGYSSLSYLKRFPVDSLKIDRSFVAEIVSDKTDLKIAENIVKLAHDLSLNVVAEGVETKEQLNLIRSIGCDELQGYIFSRPISGKQMDEKLLSDEKLYI